MTPDRGARPGKKRTRPHGLRVNPRQPSQRVVAEELSKNRFRETQAARRLAVVFHRYGAGEKSPVAIVNEPERNRRGRGSRLASEKSVA